MSTFTKSFLVPLTLKLFSKLKPMRKLLEKILVSRKVISNYCQNLIPNFEFCLLQMYCLSRSPLWRLFYVISLYSFTFLITLNPLGIFAGFVFIYMIILPPLVNYWYFNGEQFPIGLKHLQKNWPRFVGVGVSILLAFAFFHLTMLKMNPTPWAVDRYLHQNPLFNEYVLNDQTIFAQLCDPYVQNKYLWQLCHQSPWAYRKGLISIWPQQLPFRPCFALPYDSTIWNPLYNGHITTTYIGGDYIFTSLPFREAIPGIPHEQQQEVALSYYLNAWQDILNWYLYKIYQGQQAFKTLRENVLLCSVKITPEAKHLINQVLEGSGVPALNQDHYLKGLLLHATQDPNWLDPRNFAVFTIKVNGHSYPLPAFQAWHFKEGPIENNPSAPFFEWHKDSYFPTIHWDGWVQLAAQDEYALHWLALIGTYVITCWYLFDGELAHLIDILMPGAGGADDNSTVADDDDILNVRDEDPVAAERPGTDFLSQRMQQPRMQNIFRERRYNGMIDYDDPMIQRRLCMGISEDYLVEEYHKLQQELARAEETRRRSANMELRRPQVILVADSLQEEMTPIARRPVLNNLSPRHLALLVHLQHTKATGPIFQNIVTREMQLQQEVFAITHFPLQGPGGNYRDLSDFPPPPIVR
jgi:hypothetical protein